MANPRFSDVNPVKDRVRSSANPPSQPAPAPKVTLPAESTTSWGGLPGKSQPRDRSGGDKKIKQYAKSEGV